MRIDKITLKNNQAWVTFKSAFSNEYMGTLHLVSDDFLQEVKDTFKVEGRE